MTFCDLFGFWNYSWKTSDCENNPEISHMTEISKHTAYVFSFTVKRTHDKTKNNQFL